MTYVDYLEDRGLAPRTVDLYDRVRRRWADVPPLAWLLGLPLSEMPSRTVACYRAAVLHWLDFTDAPYDRQQIMRKARGRAKQRHYRHAPTPDQMIAYHEALDACGIPEPCFTILRLLPYTGLRVTAACQLRSNAIGKVGSTVGLDIVGKGNKARFVPLGKRGRKILREWLKARKGRLDGERSRWLFPSPQNIERPVAADTVRLHLRQLRRDADLSADLTPHTMRHYYATTLADRGVDILTLKDLLGHASITTTQLYAQPSVARLAEAVALLDED